MKVNDKQVGRPEIVYKDTKANIEALTDVEQGSYAYATDTDQPGWYDGSTWIWGASGGGGSISVKDWNDNIYTPTTLYFPSGTIYYDNPIATIDTEIGLSLQPTVIRRTLTIPAEYQAIWAGNGFTTVSGGELVVIGEAYILSTTSTGTL